MIPDINTVFEFASYVSHISLFFSYWIKVQAADKPKCKSSEGEGHVTNDSPNITDLKEVRIWLMQL